MSISVEVSVILHLPKTLPYPYDKFLHMVTSLYNQNIQALEIIILDEQNNSDLKNSLSQMISNGLPIHIITGKSSTLGQWLNKALTKARGEALLYINNKDAEIKLRNSALSALLLSAERHPKWGFIYTDYQLIAGTKQTDIKLLPFHNGRLRDNQDYGYVYLINTKILKQCGGFDTSLKFHSLYDTRLIISEKAHIIQIGNKTGGALYSVSAPKGKHDVFDYLTATRENQLEAEQVLTAHLKRIGAFLPPGAYQHKRPEKPGTDIKASVIIPVNNRPEFIGAAIESVLNQTIQDIEVIIVVNGGDKDPTIKEVKKYQTGGTKFHEDKPQVRLEIIDINNIGFSLNCGVKAAQGIYYMQLDSDDRLKPDAIENILQVFDSDSKIGMVIGSYEVWEKNEKTGAVQRRKDIPVVTHDEWTEVNGRNNLLRINGAGAPRSIPIRIIKEMGYFGMNDESFSRNYGEDYDMVLKISENYRIGRVWDPIYEVIRHSGGTDHSIDQATIDSNDEAKDYMRRQTLKRRQKLNQKKKS
jgi:glycosyltransferase involved in cell wall biosynthesis